MSPRDYGIHLAVECGPLTPEQIEGAARVLAGVETEQQVAA